MARAARGTSVGETRPEAGTAIEDAMFRALGVLRFVLLVDAVALYAHRRSDYDHPGVGWAVMAAPAGWTGLAVWAYSAGRRRRWPLLAAVQRLARAVHDGVLQVLILVQRRGAEFGGTAGLHTSPAGTGWELPRTAPRMAPGTAP